MKRQAIHAAKHEPAAQLRAEERSAMIASTGFTDQRAAAVAQRNMIERISRSPRMSAQRMAQNAMTDSASGKNTAQLRAATDQPNRTGLPDTLKAGVESLSGMSMDHVRVHYNSPQPAQLNAYAYAQGSDIHVAPGQEQHLPHEAWHVVQQAQGRVNPTRQMKRGVAVNDDAGLEAEADVMGSKALQTGTGAMAQLMAMRHTIQMEGAHNRGCYCPGCCTPAMPAAAAGKTYSLKSYAPSWSGVVQLATTIAIRDAAGDTVTGTSGNQADVNTKMNHWPAIKTLFQQHVPDHQMPEMENGVATGRTYARGWNFCAEPHAFASLLHRHEAIGDHTVNLAWLNGLRFPAQAVDENGHNLWPCPVCTQWVTSGALPMMLRALIKPANPIPNAAQIAEDQAKTDFNTQVTNLGAGQAVFFDQSGDTKADLASCLKYFDDLKREKGKHKDIAEGAVKAIHGQAWAGIIHANSAPDFVEEAKNLLEKMQANFTAEKAARPGGQVTLTADDKVLEAMNAYYALCEKKMEKDDDDVLKTPNNTLIANLIARAEARGAADPDEVMIEGNIRELDRNLAMQSKPDEFAESDDSDLYFTISPDGSLEIQDTVKGIDWSSSG